VDLEIPARPSAGLRVARFISLPWLVGPLFRIARRFCLLHSRNPNVPCHM
jgi:hypothetical protein